MTKLKIHTKETKIEKTIKPKAIKKNKTDEFIIKALEDLEFMGAIIKRDKFYIYLDLNILFNFGFILVFDTMKNLPSFCKLNVLDTKKNIIPYSLNLIPYVVLKSFTSIQLKEVWESGPITKNHKFGQNV